MFARKIASYAAIATLYSGSLMAANVHLDITDIAALNGEILVVLYDSPEDYSQSGAPLVSRKIPASAETVSTAFQDLPAGDYAIKLFHDENSNGQLDTNMMGLPKEGYGFSNNAGRFGPASYEEAKFSVTEDTQITIKLR
ncbi:DUF2141 domain-containing protein [Planctobacterium marinum]|uniref:DUF2141 domain-containing protein n=1 Tax=Planctobacterium marinum TaxID=1631968 RepID=A0AA48KQV0_9ALTE|nr:hypothetical protein MACH26_03100 [Planctobacterium marinum]